MLVARVEEQLRQVARLDQGTGGIDVLEEELVALLPVHLHRDARGPRRTELRDREARVHEQGAARAVTRLGELLRRHHPEREPGVDDVGADALGGLDAALGELARPPAQTYGCCPDHQSRSSAISFSRN